LLSGSRLRGGHHHVLEHVHPWAVRRLEDDARSLGAVTWWLSMITPP
jgi:hypothetical protein